MGAFSLCNTLTSTKFLKTVLEVCPERKCGAIGESKLTKAETWHAAARHPVASLPSYIPGHRCHHHDDQV